MQWISNEALCTVMAWKSRAEQRLSLSRRGEGIAWRSMEMQWKGKEQLGKGDEMHRTAKALHIKVWRSYGKAKHREAPRGLATEKHCEAQQRNSFETYRKGEA